MAYRRRDPLAADRAAKQRSYLAAPQLPLPGPEIEATMKRIIREALSGGKDIDRGDFLRALVPASEIAPRFERLLAEVRAERRQERKR